MNYPYESCYHCRFSCTRRKDAVYLLVQACWFPTLRFIFLPHNIKIQHVRTILESTDPLISQRANHLSRFPLKLFDDGIYTLAHVQVRSRICLTFVSIEICCLGPVTRLRWFDWDSHGRIEYLARSCGKPIITRGLLWMRTVGIVLCDVSWNIRLVLQRFRQDTLALIK